MKASSAYLIAPFLGFLLAQVIKYALASRHDKNRRQFFRSGNMPSSHTAVVVSLATVIYVHEGLSTLFSVAAVLAVITIYDALVARRSIGEQGAALLRLIEKSPFAKDPLPRVALGHNPREVIAGGILGLVIGLTVAFFIT
ncbi:MAG: divergent PAP2 family protein [Candidatus Saccharimonadales bacterium]|jgi:acid phosphatase family membrane protein YuiD